MLTSRATSDDPLSDQSFSLIRRNLTTQRVRTFKFSPSQAAAATPAVSVRREDCDGGGCSSSRRGGGGKESESSCKKMRTA